jgi:endonuclease-3
MARLADALERAYGTPDLGNHADPLDEAIYILITYQTDLARARGVWTALKQRFPSWTSVLEAPADVLRELLRPAGFQTARAVLIRQLLRAVVTRWGEPDLRALAKLSTAGAETELRALPGLDIKGARCVLLYSLNRPVFPVDSNTFRFMQRFGVLGEESRYRRRATHDDLQSRVSPADRYRLHVNLVVHGQRICLPRKPKCPDCAVRRSCDYYARLRGRARVE